MSQRKFNILKITLLISCGGVNYVLPYLRFGFWDSMLLNMSITNTQMGELGAVFGIFAIPSYFLGGYLADKFPAPKLLCAGLLTSAAFGFYFSTFPGYTGLFIIHAALGISSSLPFWCAYQAMTRRAGPADEQGKVFGIVWGGRSLGYVVLSAVALWIASFFVDSGNGLSVAIIIISLVYVFVGLAFLFFWREDNVETGKDSSIESAKFKLSDVGTVLRMPSMWLVAIALFFVYGTMRLGDIFTPYASSSYGLALSAEAAGFLGQVKMFGMAPISGLLAFFLADKVGLVRFSSMLMFTVVLLAIALIIVPTSNTVIMVVIILSLMMFCWTAYSLIFSLLDVAGIPDKVTGTFVGMISGIAFSSEPIVIYLGGYMIDAYPGIEGFHIIFQMMIAGGLISIITYFFISRLLKRQAQSIRDSA